MSEDRQEPDSPDQATDTTPSADPKATSSNDGASKAPAKDAASSLDTAGQDGTFEPVSIRSYLAEQFGVREVATPDQHAAPVAPPTDANAELAKWRERVPKLASALRDRTAQIDLLEQEIARLQDEAQGAAGPSLKARDEHITQLESKLTGLTAKYQNSEGRLRESELELEDLRADVETSKQRWQTLTESLDVQVASTEQAQKNLQAATEREAEQQKTLADLTQRNENLNETTELANRQLASLSDDLSRLQSELLDQEQTFAAKLAEQSQAGLLETAQIQAEHSERLRDIHAQTLLVFDAVEQQNAAERLSDCETLRLSLQQEFSVREAVLQQEVAALQSAAAGLMQQIHYLQGRAVQQQRSQIQAAAEYHAQQQQQTSDHKQALAHLTLALEAEVDLLQLELVELSKPKEPELPRIVMLGEISDSSGGRSDFVREWRSLDDNSIDAANETILELERLLKIRNEELSAARASRVHFLPATTKSNAVVDDPQLEAAAEVVQPSTDGDSVASLRAQVESANAENARLRQQLERTSAALLASDDLTQLKGVGGKLAEQLRELGISQFAQMAALNLDELEDPDHPLFNMRGRIERNGWIEQSKALVHPLTLYGER